MLLARTAATVDAMTGGRLVLGLGTGYAQAEHDAMGLPINDPGPRVRRFAETLEVLRSLLDTDAATFDGEFHHVAVESLGIRPAQAHVPFLIGGHGRRVVGAGRPLRRHLPVHRTHPRRGRDARSPAGSGVADLRQRAEWLSADAGPRDADIERSALVQVLHVGPGGRRRDRRPRRALRGRRAGARRDAVRPRRLVEQIVDKLERLRADLGISHYVIRDAEQFAPVVAALAGR